jgi:plastocyanin
MNTISCRNPLTLALLLLLGLIMPIAASGESWHATVGAQSTDMGEQALAFLPEEMWVHTGDSVTWTFSTNEPHTLTFLMPLQIRPPFPVGCPGTTPSGSMETSSTCINSGVLTSGQSYTVVFPAAGNYKLVCLVHNNMTATIHVLNATEPLPYDQAFYDAEAANQQRNLLTDPMLIAPPPLTAANGVVAGVGEVVAHGGGAQTVSVVRFISATKLVHAGETVEWTNEDAVTPHTITFGPEPPNLMAPSPNVTLDADGARHAVISSPTDTAHSGLIAAAFQDRVGLPQAPLGVTRFRVTFINPGVFNYKCSLHDNLGMVGEVIVLP